MQHNKKDKEDSPVTIIYALLATIAGIAVALLAYM